MRLTAILSVIVVILLSSSSCHQRARGRRAMTPEDSLRRVRAIAEEAYLTEMEKVKEDLTGPTGSTGDGAVATGVPLAGLLLDDSTRAVIARYEKHNARITRAMKDSTTYFGVLMSRFNVQDSMHKYMAATYSHSGTLLTFHSEVQQDERHKLDFDFYFDKGSLVYYRERVTYTIDGNEDDREQDAITDDSYFVSGDRALYGYRDDGRAPHVREHADMYRLTRYALKGDLTGHVAKALAEFRSDYRILQDQPMEMMVYTPAVRVPVPEAAPAVKSAPTRGPAF